MQRTFLLSLFPFILFSCQNKPGIDKIYLHEFAEMECRAIQFRQSRFALADKIRFTQDTLMQNIPATDKSKLKERLARFEIEKQTLVKESLLLADSIKTGLDSLMQHVLITADDKKAFDLALKNELRQLGCE